ncbi:MAG: hypothetical protein M3507_02905, partial [Actinomycetota bacterium]|nr:hypothetical protein [Actinomycetota bacterium]
AISLLAKLAWEACLARHLRPGAPPELRRSALLLVGELASSSRWRFGLGLTGVLSALVATMGTGSTTPVVVLVLAVVCLATVVAGELVERWQFFTAVAPPRMPSSPG